MAALDAASVLDVQPLIPGGGGPGYEGPDGRGGGGDGDHEDRGASLTRIFVLLIMVSVTALFVALALVFWLRSRTPFLWQPIEAPRALWLSTLVLAASSAMLEFARRGLAERRWFAYRRRLLLTIYLGLGFIACQGAALLQLARNGMFLAGNPHASVFYVFTGAHGLHLAFGMGALNYLLFKRKRTLSQHRTLSGSIALYWHFMGVVWLGLFGLLLAW